MAGSIAGSSDREYRRGAARFDSGVTKRIGLLGRLREHYGMNVLVAKANTRRTCTAPCTESLPKACFSGSNAGEVQGCDRGSCPARRAGRHPRMHRVRHAPRSRRQLGAADRHDPCTRRGCGRDGPAGVSHAGPSDVPVMAGAPDWYLAGVVRRMLEYSATRRREHDRRPLSDPPGSRGGCNT
jgi:hypothetical protein